MKTALILIPQTDESVNRYAYMQACIEYAENDGCTVDCPSLQESFSTRSAMDYLDKRLAWADVIYLFTDFGIDKTMFEIIDRLVNAGRRETLVYKKLHEVNLEAFYTTPVQILRDVSRRTGISVEQLVKKTRNRSIVDARFIYFRRCREISNSSLSEIGLPVGLDHATVLHGWRQAMNVPELQSLYEKCYEQTEIKKQTMDTQEARYQTNVREIERPVLPYRSMDKREQVVQAEVPSVRDMSDGWTYRPFSGYRPHNT